MPDEQELLLTKALDSKIVLGLICGSDGVAAISYDDYRTIAPPRKSSVHIACYREHREHYEVNGPDGTLAEKIPPSNWQRILNGPTP
jgi:hypothetical protein